MVWNFCFNDTATTEIYTLSLRDALPISGESALTLLETESPDLVITDLRLPGVSGLEILRRTRTQNADVRSEEHTSELQSRQYLVCRLLLEKKEVAQRPSP